MPQVTIDREALPATLAAAVPAAVAALTGHRRTALALTALPVAIAAFFRDPEREPDRGAVPADEVRSPADGKVMYAGPAQTDVAPDGDWHQVSIFLSGFDVHINRSPYAGTVTEVGYRPGRWLAAYRAESATENERSEIHLRQDGPDGERLVIFRQIVGLMARRVVTRVQPGDVLTTGQRMGLMKFGSRMDVFVPPQVELVVTEGDRVVAGETVLGRWA